jgi:lysozyme family protein
MAQFEPAVEWVLSHEGVTSDDKDDSGGLTKYGISQAAHPEVDIASLTLDQAKAIYRRSYWENQRYREIQNQRVATKIFDMSVNMGFHQAHMIAQAQVEAVEDGVLGPASIAAINAEPADRLLADLCMGCVDFYHDLVNRKPSNAKFLKGWLARAKDLPPASMSPNTGLMEGAGK